ncbi:MAG: UDP-N-acetylglucosamine diphosphorylase [Verrucomicrobiae bacterium]|nr:UDP-N-acetylglucosamine diphosphorylase [Verrucomicrobiae bacterium]
MTLSFPAAPSDYLDLSHTAHASLFDDACHVWDPVARIAAYLAERLESANHGKFIANAYVGERVYIGKGTTIQPGATILGPAWIGENVFIGAGCLIRENVLIDDGAIVGNSSEFKNCVLFERAEVPHFNYVGDSILGYRAHLAAGVILSNYRLDHGVVDIPDPAAPGSKINTGLEKFGAVVGDNVDIGCNAVISPGSLLGPRSVLYPGVHWRGVLPADKIVKVRQQQQIVDRKPALM